MAKLKFPFFIKKDSEERSHFPVERVSTQTPLFYNGELNPTVSTCVNKIANTLCILPLNVYSHTKTGKKKAYNYWLSRLLEHPSFEETSNLFFNELYRQMLLKGNGCAFLTYGSDGNPVNMQIIDSATFRIERDENNKKRFYLADRYYTEREILQIPYPGPGYNGTKGVSPIDTLKDVIALNDSLLTYVSYYFDNSLGTRMGLELSENLTDKMKDLDKAYATLMPYINKFVVGNKNAGKLMIPPPGSKFTKLDQPTNAESELRSLISLTERLIAQGFNVPYEIINSEANKYNSLEAKILDFLANCIQPLGDHVCHSFDKRIPAKDNNLYCQYEYKNLLTTDTAGTVSALKEEFMMGAITQNEMRKKLGLEDIGPAGDYLWIPANMLPVTEENIAAYMAKQKSEVMAQHSPSGDDKA